MRKFIKIVNEFFFPYDPNDGSNSNQTVVITNIIWDVDEEEAIALKLPNRAVTTMHDVEEAADPYADEEYRHDQMHMIGDWLTSTFDSRLSDFDFSIH